MTLQQYAKKVVVTQLYWEKISNFRNSKSKVHLKNQLEYDNAGSLLKESVFLGGGLLQFLPKKAS